MHIVAKRALQEFWKKHGHAEQALRTWFAVVSAARWQGPADIKAQYASASFLEGDRVVFNIKGNSYRLVVHIRYDWHMVFVRFVGTHGEYDQIDAATV
jgi:mRNA interferase HigB